MAEKLESKRKGLEEQLALVRKRTFNQLNLIWSLTHTFWWLNECDKTAELVCEAFLPKEEQCLTKQTLFRSFWF